MGLSQLITLLRGTCLLLIDVAYIMMRKIIDHLLLHCKFGPALWGKVFLMFGVQWVMLNTVVSLLFAQRN